MSISYQVFEINSFNILQVKLEDLQREKYSVEITPISNSNGDITKYFIFAKKLEQKKFKEVKERDINNKSSLSKFYGKA